MTNPQPTAFSTLLKPSKDVGIVGYGAYVPRYRLPAREVARVWMSGKGSLPVKEKAVPGLDEDVATMSIEAARKAMTRAGIDPRELRAVWVGSESHPYAVKPTSTLVAEAIGAVPHTRAADWEFACKAGTEALVAAMGLVGSGMGHYAMAIGMDTELRNLCHVCPLSIGSCRHPDCRYSETGSQALVRRFLYRSSRMRGARRTARG